MTRWSIRVFDETDKMLRQYLADRKMGGISAFVQKAVTEKIFRRAVRDVQKRNLRFTPAEIDADIEEAVSAVRAASRS